MKKNTIIKPPFNERAKNYFRNIRPTKNFVLLIPFVIIAILFILIPIILIVIKSFTPVDNSTISENWLSVDKTIFQKLGVSLLISIVTTLFCLLIGFPFAYFVGRSKNKFFVAAMTILITAPVWTSLLIKLIGLKLSLQTFFTNGNELLGQLWTYIGITYTYLPFMILPLINNLKDLPQNLLEASSDLGRKSFHTLFKVIIPWSKPAIISGLMLVFLPALTSVAIPAFLNHASNGPMIGNVVYSYGERGFLGGRILANAASLSLVVSLVMFVIYGLVVMTPKLISKISYTRSLKNVNSYKKLKGGNI